ncbi:hypothetical protein [Streptomyces jumonjinensis]|uniref:hypothetical protein n=1 Tax=Streptomyces jumonjinensis TaxID=1945 RepID=UPI00379C0A39
MFSFQLHRRRAAQALVALLFACGATLAAPPVQAASAATPTAAAAAAPLVECASGNLTLNFSPGLLLTTVQHETYSGNGRLTACVDSRYPLNVFSGTVSVSGQAEQSCLTSQNDSGTFTVIWNGGNGPTTSTAEIMQLGPVESGDAVAITSFVTSGRYAGQIVVIEWLGLPIGPGSCAEPPGVQTVSGIANGTVLPV